MGGDWGVVLVLTLGPGCEGSPGRATRAYQAGEVVAVHHAFPGGRHRMASALRALVSYDEVGSDGNPCLYIGEWPVRASAEPTCYLAPSIDGGMSRRLIAVRALEESAQLTVPLGATTLAWMARDIGVAVAAAGASHRVVGRDDVRDAGPLKGRGVFAHRPYAAGETIGRWPAWTLPASAVPSELTDYVYAAVEGGSGSRLLVFGHGMLYNHADVPNVKVVWNAPPADAGVAVADVDPYGGGEDQARAAGGEAEYVATMDVPAGAELVMSYGEGWWASRPALARTV